MFTFLENVFLIFLGSLVNSLMNDIKIIALMKLKKTRGLWPEGQRIAESEKNESLSLTIA